MEHTKSSSKRKTYSNTGLLQERKKNQINNATYNKSNYKRKNKAEVSKRKEIIKIRMEIN